MTDPLEQPVTKSVETLGHHNATTSLHRDLSWLVVTLQLIRLAQECLDNAGKGSTRPCGRAHGG